MCIIPDYCAALDSLLRVLKPDGRLAILGMKCTSHGPLRVFNPAWYWMNRTAAADVRRDIPAYFRERGLTFDYAEYFGGFYYLLSLTRPQNI